MILYLRFCYCFCQRTLSIRSSTLAHSHQMITSIVIITKTNRISQILIFIYTKTIKKQMDEKCVCGLCTCGQHSCPEPGLQSTPFQAQTTNQIFYKPIRNYSPPKSFSPSRNQIESRNYPRQDLVTTYRHEFSPPKLENNNQRLPRKKWAEYQANKHKFQGMSQYKQKYLKKQKHPDQPLNFKRSPQRSSSPTKFEGTTTYQIQFSPKKISSNSPSYNKKQLYNHTNITPTKFEAVSTYQNQYSPHKITSRSPLRRRMNDQSGIKPTDQKFDGSTSYKTNYRPYTADIESSCPVKFMPKRPNRCSPGKKHIFYSPEKNKWI